MDARPSVPGARRPRLASPYHTYMARVFALLTTLPEAAAALGVSRQRVLQLVAAGRLETFRHGGRVYVDPVSLCELLVARARSPRRPPPARPRRGQ